ncbi:MAG: glycoside hydrolase family 2 TIM barrel-domain containing protein, partial [Ruthenibacterium sp.]
SCGNESFGGKTIFEMSNFFRANDPTRLVHYEGVFHDRRYPDTSDMESQMYTPQPQVERFLQEHPDKPLILCEYSHAMGNSCGGLRKYTDYAMREPRFQGGFIWDYIDQAILKKAPDGKEFFAYGGDFDDAPTDYNFCANGLVYADRKNSPKMQEVRSCYQNFVLTLHADTLTLTNRSLFTDANEYNLVLRLCRNGAVLDERISVLDAQPGQTVQSMLPFTVPTENAHFSIDAALTLKQDTIWAKAGHTVAFGQWTVHPNTKTPLKTPCKLVDSDVNIGIRGAHFSLLFSRSAGALVSYRVMGREWLRQPMQLNFWRASTDNDKGCAMPFHDAQWMTAGIFAKFIGVNVTERDGFPLIVAEYQLPILESTVQVEFSADGNGTLHLALVWQGAPCDVPEFGFLLVLNAQQSRVAYLGDGPEETASDRKSGARFGRFAFAVEENLSNYVMPQECGGRTGVYEAEVRDERGSLGFYGEGMFFFALPYTPLELESARHPSDLPAPNKTVVRCALGQRGVGGDN